MSTEFSTEFASVMGEGARPGAAPGRTLNLMRLIRLRTPMMAVVFFALAAPSALGVWFFLPKEYTATAMILCQSTTTSVLSGDQQTTNLAAYMKYLNTQISKIKESVLTRVVADPEIRQLAWLKDKEDPYTFLQGYIDAKNPRETEIISVSCTAPDAQTAKVIVNALCKKYIEGVSLEGEMSGTSRLAALREEETQLERQLGEEQLKLKEKRQAVGTPVTGDSQAFAQLSEYTRQHSQALSDLTTLSNEIAQKKATIEQIRALQEKHRANPGVEIPEFGVENIARQSGEVASIQQQVSALEAEIARLEGAYKTEGPLQARRNNLSSVKGRLEQAHRAARARALEALLAQTQFELQQLEQRKTEAQTRADEFKALMAEQEKRATDFEFQAAEITYQETRVNEIKARLDAIKSEIYRQQVESKAPARVQLVNEAIAPTSPDNSKRIQFTLLCVAAAGAVALGLGLLRELTDQDVRSSQDVSYVTALPVLAAIPHISADHLADGAVAPLVTLDRPKSTIADEYRRVLTRIVYPPEGSVELNTTLIVSASRGDGKTSLACNLAVTLAQANRRVLLVDISARHPSIETCFDMTPAPGLSEILLGEAGAGELTRPAGVPGLFVLGPGYHDRELIGKLASRDMVEFLEAAEESFDHVVIDTPPALIMSDAKLLAPVVDGVILVAGAGVTRLGMLRRCLQDLQQIGANVIGIVVNGVRPQRGGYLQGNLKMYYQYSEGREPRARRAPAPQEPEIPMMMLVDEPVEQRKQG